MRVVWRPLAGNLLGSACLLLALAGIAVGLPAVDGALPAQRPVASGQPYPVGAGVSLVPPPGARVDLTRTRPGISRGTALFVRGAVRVHVAVAPFDGDLDQAAARLRVKITATRGYQVTGREVPVATASGLPGRQGGYTTPGGGGRYAVFLLGGLAVEVTASGSHVDLSRSLPEIQASTDSIRYGRRR